MRAGGVYTIEMFAIVCGVQARTVRKWIKDDQLPAQKDYFTGQTFISVVDASVYLGKYPNYEKGMAERLKSKAYLQAMWRLSQSLGETSRQLDRARTAVEHAMGVQMGLKDPPSSRSSYYISKEAAKA